MAQATQLVQAGIAAARDGDLSRARALLRKAIAHDPNLPNAWVWLAGVAEHPAHAIPSLEQALKLDPKNGPAKSALKVARVEAGVAAAQANRCEEAYRFLRQAVVDDPRNESAWLWLAGVTADPFEAIEHIERALALNPGNERARAGLERFRAMARKSDRWFCPICLARANERFATCPECHAVLDLAHGDSAIGNPCPDVDKIKAGAARLAERVRTQPDFANHYYLGMALLNLARPDEALGHFQTARTFKPNDAGLAAQVELLRKALDEATQPTRRLKAAPRRSIVSNNKSVLVVDHSATIRKLIGVTMRKNGYHVLEAQDGEEALDLIETEGSPDVVILDGKMPRLDGYALCRALRKNPSTSEVPVIMLSSHDEVIDKPRGRTAGVDAFLVKPFEPSSLVRTVKECCAAKT